jgi:hypothetical protein
MLAIQSRNAYFREHCLVQPCLDLRLYRCEQRFASKHNTTSLIRQSYPDDTSGFIVIAVGHCLVDVKLCDPNGGFNLRP